MIKYTVETVKYIKLGFVVKETPTGKQICFSVLEDACKDYIPKLNKGSGFNGNTPAFFCDPVLNLD